MIDESIIIYNKMSLSVCAISGKPLQHPVLSIKTGHLYEKEVIEKHLSSFPYCPLTNQPIQITDLIEIVPNQSNYVRVDQSSRSYLNKLQQQYDLLVVDAFNIRKSLKQTEQELTSSLYQNEAASRVIARLLKQKQEAQSQIVKLQSRIGQLKQSV